MSNWEIISTDSCNQSFGNHSNDLSFDSVVTETTPLLTAAPLFKSEETSKEKRDSMLLHLQAFEVELSRINHHIASKKMIHSLKHASIKTHEWEIYKAQMNLESIEEDISKAKIRLEDLKRPKLSICKYPLWVSSYYLAYDTFLDQMITRDKLKTRLKEEKKMKSLYLADLKEIEFGINRLYNQKKIMKAINLNN